MAKEGTQIMKRAKPARKAPTKKAAAGISGANSETSTSSTAITEPSITTTASTYGSQPKDTEQFVAPFFSLKLGLHWFVSVH